MKTAEDLTGKKFGKLTVICRGEDHWYKNGTRNTVWHCKCDCGNEVDVMAKNLKRNHTTSCGCAAVDAGLKRRRDLTGERFGHLTCIRHVEGQRWLFRCDCGRETVVFSSNAVTGKTQTCGKDCGLKNHPYKDKKKKEEEA